MGAYSRSMSMYSDKTKQKYNWRVLTENKKGVKSLSQLIDPQHLHEYVCILLVSYFNLSFALHKNIIYILPTSNISHLWITEQNVLNEVI